MIHIVFEYRIQSDRLLDSIHANHRSPEAGQEVDSIYETVFNDHLPLVTSVVSLIGTELVPIAVT